jgi:hypothetical protein
LRMSPGLGGREVASSAAAASSSSVSAFNHSRASCRWRFHRQNGAVLVTCR